MNEREAYNLYRKNYINGKFITKKKKKRKEQNKQTK